ncbi:hypothetical protein possibly linked to type III secretion (plasmid) [Sinorhizobium fredii NGR234]|uniref:Uncharacterized protein n=1 Tax=Sinorhizobium fredii (strain NBRC 101917 / NGR234) TaxID=394 RepID=C3KNA6_SINFN|nr:hypothetical protein [Sinorhizobium fredii]ACP23736.1 hypothetical protein possibly linked to type III secretion [Sinorhizobium fredii NGR234]
MTVVPPVENAFVTAPAPQDSIPIASQGLFEHAALNAGSLPHGASPADLGRTVVDNLKGFVERAGKFANGSAIPAEPGQSPTSSSFLPLPGGDANAARTPDSDAGRLVETLGRVFDHAIETQMVVRGPTQFTSATLTLVKGQ